MDEYRRDRSCRFGAGYSLRSSLRSAIISSAACSGVRPSTTTRWTAVLRPSETLAAGAVAPRAAPRRVDVRLGRDLHHRLIRCGSLGSSQNGWSSSFGTGR